MQAKTASRNKVHEYGDVGGSGWLRVCRRAGCQRRPRADELRWATLRNPGQNAYSQYKMPPKAPPRGFQTVRQHPKTLYGTTRGIFTSMAIPLRPH